MLISEWIQRLLSETDLDVHGAASLFAAQADQLRNGVWVLLNSEQASPNLNTTGPLRQTVTMNIGVVLAVFNQQDAVAALDMTELEKAREKVRTALLGWQPASADSAVQFVAGRELEYDDSIQWWIDEFSVTYLLSEN